LTLGRAISRRLREASSVVARQMSIAEKFESSVERG